MFFCCHLQAYFKTCFISHRLMFINDCRVYTAARLSLQRRHLICTNCHSVSFIYLWLQISNFGILGVSPLLKQWCSITKCTSSKVTAGTVHVRLVKPGRWVTSVRAKRLIDEAKVERNRWLTYHDAGQNTLKFYWGIRNIYITINLCLLPLLDSLWSCLLVSEWLDF
jgi:hypothetical protein